MKERKFLLRRKPRSLAKGERMCGGKRTKPLHAQGAFRVGCALQSRGSLVRVEQPGKYEACPLSVAREDNE